MANLYSNGVDQAIDSNGDVYPSAQRYFYDNNTTNLRTIWQDKAKTSAHANPVVANAAGVFPDIFIEGSYSTRLETSAGALIDTQDDVNVFETDLLASQSTTGAALTNLDYDEASSSGLSFAYSSGRVDDEDGTITEISSGALTLPSTQTSYIYLDYRSHTVVQQTTTGRPVSSLLYTVVTDGGAITSVTRNKDVFREPHHLVNGYKDGLIPSIAADADHDITVSTGRARDSSDTLDLILSSALTKQLDANWAAGDAAGGLPITVTLVDAMTLYVFVIAKTDGSIDVGFDDNTSATKLLAASTYTHYLQIGSFTINVGLNIATDSLVGVSANTQALSVVDDVVSGRTALKIQTAAYDTGSVDEAAIGAGAVHQSELDTGLQSVGVGSGSYAVLTGGQYGFYPSVSGHPGISTEVQIASNIIGSVGGTVISNDSASLSITVQQRYINASAPYVLGNNEVPLFIFVAIDEKDEMLISASEAPPWIYNGPTDVTGKKFRRKDGSVFYGRYQRPSELQAARDGVTIADLIANKSINPGDFVNETPELVEITPQDKNADMRLIPTPYPTIKKGTLLLDPFSPLMPELLALHQADADIIDIVKNYLVVDNEDNGHDSAPGVMPVNIKWKDSSRK